MIRVCIVDDDSMLLAGMKRVLRRVCSEIDLTLCESGAEALHALQAQPMDVLISDLRMPGMDGQALMTTAQKQFPDVARVLMTGDLDPQQTFALQLVAHRIVAKPIDAITLRSIVEELGNSCARVDCTEMRWAHMAAHQLTEQRATSITVDSALNNPWLAVLLLQATNGGFVPGKRSLHVEAAVRSLGPVHLAIIFERLVSLSSENERATSGDYTEPEPALHRLLGLARENAGNLGPLYVGRFGNAELTVSDFVGIVESAVLLRAAAVETSGGFWADREHVLRAAWGAARLGVPSQVVTAVRESVNEAAGEHVSAGAVVKFAFEACRYESVI